MKRENFNRLSPEAIERLEKLARVPDEAIDTSDAPEVRDWTGAKRGLFLNRPNETDQVAIGLSAGIFDWFRDHAQPGENPEATINRVLREHIAEEMKKAS